jgi:pimeloyl-ACP methyl ester carboxylesterase
VKFTVIATAAWLACLPAFAAKPTFDARECSASAAAAHARCGVVYVPENYAKPHLRKIPLNVIVLPATQPPPENTHAQYDLEGGPGFAVTGFLKFYAGEGAPYRATHDIVLADMRGTGGSNPLHCFDIEAREKRLPTAPMYPPELVKACADVLSVANDPSQYTTAAAARDIDAVRVALGFRQLDLNAVSYGTTLALRYIADYPTRVRTAVLTGAVPANRTPPRYHAIAAEVSLKRLGEECSADADCEKQSGNLQANLHAALTRVATVPGFTAPVFMEQLRKRLYAPATRVRIPYLLSLAAQGDFTAFTEASQDSTFSDGLYLSITCSESFAWMDVNAAIEAARNSHFGPYRLERQRDACKQWPVSARDVNLMKQPSSRVPVLFITGDLDPVSPSDWTHEVAKHFANSRIVSVPHGAHVFDGLSGLDTCLDAVTIRFMNSAALDLDTSCFNTMSPPPFGAAP